MSAAVVDSELRVHGVEGLRVMDASVMPTVVSGNTNRDGIMIAEKGAEMILAAARSGAPTAPACPDGQSGLKSRHTRPSGWQIDGFIALTIMPALALGFEEQHDGLASAHGGGRVLLLRFGFREVDLLHRG